MKNKHGFTLVEIMVCIVIISALAIVIGINVNKMTGQTRDKANKDTIEKIKEAAMVYSNIDDSCRNEERCSFNLEKLVEAGLLSEDYYNQINVICNNNSNFAKNDQIDIEIRDGEKKVIYCSQTL